MKSGKRYKFNSTVNVNKGPRKYNTAFWKGGGPGRGGGSGEGSLGDGGKALLKNFKIRRLEDLPDLFPQGIRARHAKRDSLGP